MNVVTKNAVPRRRSTPRELMIALIDDHRGAYVVEPICKIVADRPFDLPYAYSPPVGAAERLFFLHCMACHTAMQSTFIGKQCHLASAFRASPLVHYPRAVVRSSSFGPAHPVFVLNWASLSPISAHAAACCASPSRLKICSTGLAEVRTKSR